MRADGLIEAEDEIEDDLLDFDEGDDLEPELRVALSNEDRQAADKNCLQFDAHVAQVSSSGLTVGPFRTPIEPCTSSNFNFNYSFGLCVATDKIWLITAVIEHLFGSTVLQEMQARFVRRWSGGVFANANTGAGKLLEHGMICGNPLKKKPELMNGLQRRGCLTQKLYIRLFKPLAGISESNLVTLFHVATAVWDRLPLDKMLLKNQICP